MIGEKWKGLSADDKKEYDEKAAKDKERYQKEMESYGGSSGASKKPAAKKEKVRAWAMPASARAPSDIPAVDAADSLDLNMRQWVLCKRQMPYQPA